MKITDEDLSSNIHNFDLGDYKPLSLNGLVALTADNLSLDLNLGKSFLSKQVPATDPSSFSAETISEIRPISAESLTSSGNSAGISLGNPFAKLATQDHSGPDLSQAPNQAPSQVPNKVNSTGTNAKTGFAKMFAQQQAQTEQVVDKASKPIAQPSAQPITPPVINPADLPEPQVTSVAPEVYSGSEAPMTSASPVTSNTAVPQDYPADMEEAVQMVTTNLYTGDQLPTNL